MTSDIKFYDVITGWPWIKNQQGKSLNLETMKIFTFF